MADPGKPVIVTAQRGGELRCRGWRQEAILRMLENVLEIGERPEDLVVYAARGKAARDWESYVRIVESLRHLGEDETLVVQSGKPVAVFPSSPDAPLVVMACGNVVGHYATAEYFDELCDRGLIMWGGLTAGDWQYIGFQGVLQGVYELLQAVGKEHFGGSLDRRFVLTAGLGGMGSAQPLAIAMAGGCGIVVEIDPEKCSRALERGHLASVTDDLDKALALVGPREAGSVIGLVGNAASIYSEIAEKRVVPDVVTDLTAAHDAVFGYCPVDYSLEQWRESSPPGPDGRRGQGPPLDGYPGPGDAETEGRRCDCVRGRQQPAGAGRSGWRARRLHDRRVRREVPEATVLPGNRAVPLGSPER